MLTIIIATACGAVGGIVGAWAYRAVERRRTPAEIAESVRREMDRLSARLMGPS